MGNLGWSEMFFIVVFALIIFGPRRIPEIAKVLGKTMAQLRNASEEFKRTWESEIEREAIKDQKQQAANSTAPTNTVPQEAAATNTEAAATNPYETIPPEPESAQAHPPWESAQAPAFLKEASIKDS